MNANTDLVTELVTDLIPITKLKISKEKWLETQIKYDENLLVKDIVDMMSEKTFHWIQSKSDLQLIVDQDSFKEEFINLLYDKYLNGRNECSRFV